MFHPDQLSRPSRVAVVVESVRAGACLVEGCTCKDARIVSRRRAAFVASLARSRGETADRVISVDPAWRVPSVTT